METSELREKLEAQEKDLKAEDLAYLKTEMMKGVVQKCPGCDRASFVLYKIVPHDYRLTYRNFKLFNRCFYCDCEMEGQMEIEPLEDKNNQ
jgi:hypothetical protein